MLKIGLIIGSTRQNRFADVPTRWIEDGASKRSDLRVETLDLRDYDLPFFDEPLPPAYTGGVFTRLEAERWRRKLEDCDGFIATVAEYNHGPTAVLKNAFDSALLEWRRKPIGFVGYGGVGAARAIEQLNGVAIALQLAPVKAVNIGMEPFMGVLQHGKSLDEFPYLVEARDAQFDELAWWGRALRDARQARLSRAA